MKFIWKCLLILSACGACNPPGTECFATTILGLEGAGDFHVIENAIGKPLMDEYNDVHYQHAEWQQWKEFALPGWDVIIGHSLGGDSAIQLCNWLKEHGLQQPKLLITIAARHQSFASWIDLLAPFTLVQNFTAPNSVTHNFWTYGPLPSAPIDGAIENVNVFPYWHGSAVAHPAIMELLKEFLDKEAVK